MNMIDVSRKNGDKIDMKKLSAALGVEIVETSALKGEGSVKAAEKAAAAAKNRTTGEHPHVFTGSVEPRWRILKTSSAASCAGTP